MVNINSEVIVERIQKDGVNTIIIAAVIAILSWIFNMYHKSANKYRDQKDQQFREARATFESALKQINKDDTDFNEFYDLLKYTKTTDEYYQLDQLINDKNKEEIKKYIKDKLFEINDKIPDPIINFIRSILSPYFPKIIRLIPIVTANMQGPARSPTVFDSPRAASA